VILAPAAQRDIQRALKWSEENFGKQAALRYRALLKQALRDIEADPERPGSIERTEIMIAGARTYHFSFSRPRVGSAGVVKAPRHFLLFRRTGLGVVEVSRVLHDASDLERHLPQGYRRNRTPSEGKGW
jgi:toxin ParE1/3/4